MSLRCSIFGHSFGDLAVEREREEAGNEVVITVQEIETCGRCGEQRVVSENKEVTTLETAADIVADDLVDDPDTAEGQPDDTEGAAGKRPAVTQADASEPHSSDVDPHIPDAETGQPANGTTPDPTPTDASADDGVILETDEADSEESGERQPGEWPEEPADGEDDWEPETSPERTGQDGPAVEPTGSAVTVPEGTFFCGECEFSTPVEESSLREGDFCPECHRGTLAHEPDQ